MWDSHSCACTWGAIVTILVVGGSCLNVSSSGGFSVNETSCEISASVWTWKVPVRLIPKGTICMSAFRVPWVCKACRSGS